LVDLGLVAAKGGSQGIAAVKMGRDSKEAIQVAFLVLCIVAQAVCVFWITAEL
jgi:hypothetical protein